jgi:hypothetical protein
MPLILSLYAMHFAIEGFAEQGQKGLVIHTQTVLVIAKIQYLPSQHLSGASGSQKE